MSCHRSFALSIYRVTEFHHVPWWTLGWYRSLIVFWITYNISYSIYAYRHFYRDDDIYRRSLIFYKSSDIMITFIDSPSSTRNLKCTMITILIDIIMKTVGNMDLEKNNWLVYLCRVFVYRLDPRHVFSVSSWIVSVDSVWVCRLPTIFYDNIMKYCVQIMSVEYVRFGNNIFKLQSSHIFSIVFCLPRYYITSVTILPIRLKKIIWI